MSGELDKVAAETGIPAQKLKEHKVLMQANAMASAEALPGPAREAFSPCPDIKVGPYDVRACYDGDIEYLSLLGHPLHEMRLQAQMEKSADIPNLYQPTGPMAWQLCWLFTRSLDEIDGVVEKGGLDAFKSAAKKEFSRWGLSELIQLSEACITQYGRYWEPVLSYGPASTDDESAPVPKKN